MKKKNWLLVALLALGIIVPTAAMASSGEGEGGGSWWCPCCD